MRSRSHFSFGKRNVQPLPPNRRYSIKLKPGPAPLETWPNLLAPTSQPSVGPPPTETQLKLLQFGTTP